MKLTKTQEAILRRLDGGGTIVFRKGLYGDYYWKDDYDARHPRPDSVDKLYRAGLIEATEDDWHYAEYTITDAGRKYLEGLDAV